MIYSNGGGNPQNRLSWRASCRATGDLLAVGRLTPSGRGRHLGQRQDRRGRRRFLMAGRWSGIGRWHLRRHWLVFGHHRRLDGGCRFAPAADAGGHRLLGGDAAGGGPLGGGVDGMGGFQGLDPLGEFGTEGVPASGVVPAFAGTGSASPALSRSRKPVNSAR